MGSYALVFDPAGNHTHRYLHGPQVDQILTCQCRRRTVLNICSRVPRLMALRARGRGYLYVNVAYVGTVTY
ncbi:MAG: hypothetical protein AAGE59_09125 [Cyanobacteria bacterium P01_F01_bin.86]